jgi:hypothetical protein
MEKLTERREQLIDQYAGGPDLMFKALQGLADDQLELKLLADSWSIRELVHHVADGDYLWKEFLLRAMGEPEWEFSLEWYWCLPQDEWVKRWSYAERDVWHSLELFKANRQHTVELLNQVPTIWEKCLLLPTRAGGQERVSVGEVVEMQAGHVVGHVEDILKIRQKHGL